MNFNEANNKNSKYYIDEDFLDNKSEKEFYKTTRNIDFRTFCKITYHSAKTAYRLYRITGFDMDVSKEENDDYFKGLYNKTVNRIGTDFAPNFPTCEEEYEHGDSFVLFLMLYGYFKPKKDFL